MGGRSSVQEVGENSEKDCVESEIPHSLQLKCGVEDNSHSTFDKKSVQVTSSPKRKNRLKKTEKTKTTDDTPSQLSNQIKSIAPLVTLKTKDAKQEYEALKTQAMSRFKELTLSEKEKSRTHKKRRNQKIAKSCWKKKGDKTEENKESSADSNNKSGGNKTDVFSLPQPAGLSLSPALTYSWPNAGNMSNMSLELSADTTCVTSTPTPYSAEESHDADPFVVLLPYYIYSLDTEFFEALNKEIKVYLQSCSEYQEFIQPYCTKLKSKIAETARLALSTKHIYT